MTLRRLGPALLGTLLACTVCEGARALPQDIMPRVVNGGHPIPSNGSLLIEHRLSPPAVTVRASDGEIMFGAVLPRGPVFWMMHRYWAWVPDAPLPAGTYEVSYGDFGDDGRQTITIGDPWVPSLPELTFDLAALPSTSSMMVACEDPGTGDLVTPRPFVVELGAVSIVPEAITADASPEHLGQLLFGIRPIGDQISTFVLRPLAEIMSGSFLSAHDAYCVAIDVMDINTGVITTYETPRCVAGSDVEITIPLGFQYDAMDRQALMLPGCPAPPPLNEPEWCRVNQDACAEPMAPESCSICPPLVVEPPDAGSPDVGDEAGVSAGSDPDSRARHVSACGCRTAGERSTSTAALQLGGLLMVLYLRLAWRHRRR